MSEELQQVNNKESFNYIFRGFPLICQPRQLTLHVIYNQRSGQDPSSIQNTESTGQAKNSNSTCPVSK